MPRVSDAHREARRDEIIAAAVRAFGQKGLGRTSIADIIAEAGLSVGAIYGHFDGKQDLVAAVAQAVLGRRRDEIDEAVRSGSPPGPGEAVMLLLRGMVRDGIAPRTLVQVWAEATVDPAIRRVANEAVVLVRGALEQALRAWLVAHPVHAPDGLEAAVARLLPVMTALGQGFILQSALFDDFDEEAYLAAVRDLLPH